MSKMKNNWLKSNKSIDVSVCDMTECKEVIDLQVENEKLKENLSESEAIILTYKIERDNYKKALEEIRSYCMTDNIQKYTSNIFYYGKHSHNILKIINEVLDGK